jgi:drug/metabolite transporter (DMT)-like permease
MASALATLLSICCIAKKVQKVSVDLVDREKPEPIFASDVSWLLQKMNLLLTIVFGVVGLVLSYGFFIPPELSMFRLIAAIGVMVGYRVGQLVGRLVRPRPKRFLILIVGAVLCFYFAFGYASMMQTGSANTSDIVNLGAVLGLFFLSLGFLLPFTRVLVLNEIEILWSKAFEYFARLFRG